MSDRIFTLYTDSQALQSKFFGTLQNIIAFKDRVVESQKRTDSEMKQKIEATTQLVHQRTKEYLKQVGGNVKSGFCYSQQAAKYYEYKQKQEAERKRML